MRFSIRFLEPADLPSVVSLRRSLFRQTDRSDADLLDYYTSVFFDNPWRTEGLRSLALEGSDRSVIGVLGVIPRPLRLGSRCVEGAATTEFMVATEHQGLAGPMLLKRFLNGPQEISFADKANDSSRKISEALGGITAIWYSLYWTHEVSRLWQAIANDERKGAFGLAGSVLRPFVASADWLRIRKLSLKQSSSPEVHLEPLDVASWLELLEKFRSPSFLEPIYDEESLSWLLEKLRAHVLSSFVSANQVVDEGGNPVAWFVSQIGHRGVAELVHFGCAAGYEELLLDQLIQDAHNRGAAVVSGRIDRRLEAAVRKRGYQIRLAEPWTLVHSRSPELLGQFQNGFARFSRLDGEWWFSP